MLARFPVRFRLPALAAIALAALSFTSAARADWPERPVSYTHLTLPTM